MAWVEWDESLSVGVFQIDAQHKKWIKIINDLHTAMIERTSDEEIKQIIQELEYYSVYHFETEEKYFEELGYQDKFQHKKEHQEFVEKVKKFKTDYDNDVKTLKIDVMEYLKDWFVNHIKTSDQKYSATFIEHGIK